MTQKKRSWIRGLFRRYRRSHRLLPSHRRQRVMLAESLEQRQMLAADMSGDELTSAQQVALTAGTMLEINATIGDGIYTDADVDLYRLELSSGQEISVDVDAYYDDSGSQLSSLDSYLRIFDQSGQDITPGGETRSGYDSSENDYSGYGDNFFDDYLSFTAPQSGSYYIGVSAQSNTSYDPTSGGTGYGSSSIGSVGDYRLQLFTDAAAAPTLSISDVSVKESAGTATFDVTLSAVTADTVTVDYSTADVTATAPDDYTAVSGTLSFAPGVTTRTISVPIIDDAQMESTETFEVRLTNPTGASIGDGAAIGTITDDDSDLAGDDLTSAQQVALTAGTMLEINATIGDGIYTDADVDLYRLELSSGQEVSVDIDAYYDDSGSQLSSLDSYLRIFDQSGQDITPGGETRSGYDSSENDYSGYGDNFYDDYLSFTAPQSGSYYIGVSAQSNTSYDPTSGGTGYGSSSIGSVGDYRLQLFTDAAAAPTLSISDVSVKESAGTATFDVTLSAVTADTVTVDYSTADVTATAPGDYTAVSGTLSFAPGVTTQTISVPIIDDAQMESTETFEVRLTNPTGASIGDGIAIGTITDDDSDLAGDDLTSAQQVALTAGTMLEINATIGDGIYTDADVDLYRLELSSGQEISIDVDAYYDDSGSQLSSLDSYLRIFDQSGQDITPGGETRSGYDSSENDYSGYGENLYDDYLSFTAPQSGSYYIGVSAQNNISYNPTIGGTGSGSSSSSQLGNYRLQLQADSPPIPTLSISDVSVDESAGTATFNVKLSVAATGTVTVDYSTANLTATAPDDYTAVTGTLSFAPGVTTQPISVPIHNDTQIESTETFEVRLSGAVGAPLSIDVAVGTIFDDEPAPIQDVRLVRDTGYDSHDLRTANPTLQGRVVGDFGGASLSVEFDHDNDGTVDGAVPVAVLPDAFIYDPRETDAALESYSGPVPMRYRLAVTEADGTTAYLDWEDFHFTLQTVPASAYVVSNLSFNSGMELSGQVETYETEPYSVEMLSDCGEPMGPLEPDSIYTGDPGTDFMLPNLDPGCMPGGPRGSLPEIDIPGRTQPIPIEFDLDMDGVADGQATTDNNLLFHDALRGLPNGTHTVQARALEWNVEYGMYLKGEWTTYSFTRNGPSAPSVQELSLLNDTGSSDSDNSTQDTTLTGLLDDSASDFSHVRVEFDLDGDSVADHQMYADRELRFQYTPDGLAAGSRTVAVRSSVWDTASASTIKGPWKSISFHYAPNPLPQISGLGLLVDDGISDSDQVTTNATLIGTVSQAEDGGLRVYIDFDDDGQADAVVSPQADGQFLYDPAGLPPGVYPARVWAERTHSVFDSVEIGPIANFSFTFESVPETPLSVANLRLLNDTGTNPTDAITSDPSITGTLTGDGAVARLTIEMDTNGDGIADS